MADHRTQRALRTACAAVGASLLALARLSLAPVSGAGAATPRLTPAQRALLTSKELWATIDVCDPPDQPNTLGVRGSMPGDGQFAAIACT